MQHERCELCEGALEQRQVLARFRFKGETIYVVVIGARTAYHLARRGQRVLLLDAHVQ